MEFEKVYSNIGSDGVGAHLSEGFGFFLANVLHGHFYTFTYRFK